MITQEASAWMQQNARLPDGSIDWSKLNEALNATRLPGRSAGPVTFGPGGEPISPTDYRGIDDGPLFPVNLSDLFNNATGQPKAVSPFGGGSQPQAGLSPQLLGVGSQPQAGLSPQYVPKGPISRKYVPYEGDPLKYGMGPAHNFFDYGTTAPQVDPGPTTPTTPSGPYVGPNTPGQPDVPVEVNGGGGSDGSHGDNGTGNGGNMGGGGGFAGLSGNLGTVGGIAGGLLGGPVGGIAGSLAGSAIDRSNAKSDLERMGIDTGPMTGTYVGNAINSMGFGLAGKAGLGTSLKGDIENAVRADRMKDDPNFSKREGVLHDLDNLDFEAAAIAANAKAGLSGGEAPDSGSGFSGGSEAGQGAESNAGDRYARGGMVNAGRGRGSRGGVHPGGFIHAVSGGRSDRIPVRLPKDSYVVPADVVAGRGQGNSLAGAAHFDRMSSDLGADSLKRGGRVKPVPVHVSGGEYAFLPHQVRAIGGGSNARGADRLDRLVSAVRASTVQSIAKAPKPR